MELKKNIYHGVAYYPEVWSMRNIEKDIEIMKELGINVVRMAEFAWCYLEPEEDKFNIGIYDEVIEKLGKNGIMTIMGTPTATPPRWFTAKYPDSLYVDRNMVKANHGSREHVCYNSPDYIARTKIIVEKMAEHYGNNPYIIAWQVHNEYNCPPANECVCDNCMKAWQEWLREKYGDINTMNERWGAGVWSTRYNSFEDVIPPRPTPNGHSASMTTNYTRFVFDTVAKYNKMQVDILKKNVKVPITHNTNRVFHIDQESVFKPLDFVSFDDYSVQDNYQEAVFAAEMCRCLKRGTPFWKMETASSYSANLHGRSGYHKKGYVKAQAVLGFFAGSIGFSYWLFRQHRSGTEMPHAHLVTAWGALSRSCENVKEVSAQIKKLKPFLLSTQPKKAKVALIYSDQARAFWFSETLGGNNYANDIFAFYKSILKTSVYRDIVYEGDDFEDYQVIFAPYLMHISDTLREKLINAALKGATVVFGPYSGWRTDDHTYYTDAAFGELEKYFGHKVEDISHFYGQDAKYEAFGLCSALENIGAVIDKGIGVIRGGYYDGESLICENPLGQGKVVFLGAKLSSEMMDEFIKRVIYEKVDKLVDCEEGVILYERQGQDDEYYCLINMTDKDKAVNIKNTMREYFTNEPISAIRLKPCDYIILKKDEKNR